MRVGPSSVDSVTVNSAGIGNLAGSPGSPLNASARQSIFARAEPSVTSYLSPPQPAAKRPAASANMSRSIRGPGVIARDRKGLIDAGRIFLSISYRAFSSFSGDSGNTQLSSTPLEDECEPRAGETAGSRVYGERSPRLGR